MRAVTARAILLAGPSGAGKSRLANRLGLPILQLDDFYREGTDPSLPHFPSGAVDWDDPTAWRADDALRAIRELCRDGRTDHPIYDIGANARTGHRMLELEGAMCFVAEGIFAAELVADCGAEGMLAAAVCVRRSRWLTFALRLTRDLREHRKPPLFLLRRGWWLARREPQIVAALVDKGCVAMTPREAERHIAVLSASSPSPPSPMCTRQMDREHG
jgi:uridine kinase